MAWHLMTSPHEGRLAHEEELGMAKQLPARRQRNEPEDVDSILVRSAESIGRLIGTLQRQLDSARNQIASLGNSKSNEDSQTDSKSRRPPEASAAKAKASRPARQAASGGRKKTAAKTASSSRSKRSVGAGRRKNVSTGTAKAKRARKSR